MKFMEVVGWIAVVILAIAGVLWGETVVYGWGATSRDQEVASLQLELGRLNAYATALVHRLPVGATANALICEVRGERGQPSRFLAVDNRHACAGPRGGSIVNFGVRTETMGGEYPTVTIFHNP